MPNEFVGIDFVRGNDPDIPRPIGILRALNPRNAAIEINRNKKDLLSQIKTDVDKVFSAMFGKKWIKYSNLSKDNKKNPIPDLPSYRSVIYYLKNGKNITQIIDKEENNSDLDQAISNDGVGKIIYNITENNFSSLVHDHDFRTTSSDAECYINILSNYGIIDSDYISNEKTGYYIDGLKLMLNKNTNISELKMIIILLSWIREHPMMVKGIIALQGYGFIKVLTYCYVLFCENKYNDMFDLTDLFDENGKCKAGNIIKIAISFFRFFKNNYLFDNRNIYTSKDRKSNHSKILDTIYTDIDDCKEWETIMEPEIILFTRMMKVIGSDHPSSAFSKFISKEIQQ